MTEQPHPKTALSRRHFLATAGALTGACGGTSSVTAEYPPAASCAKACSMVDAHSHIFNGSDLPIQGFLTHILPVPEKFTRKIAAAIHKTVNKLAPSGMDELKELQNISSLIEAPDLKKVNVQLESIANELEGVLGKGLHLDGGVASATRIAQTLQLITGPRSSMAAKMASTYKQIDLFTPTLVDYTYWSDDKPETPLLDQIKVQSRISTLSRKGLIGHQRARFHPMAPYNPLREVQEAILPAPGKYTPFGEHFDPQNNRPSDAPFKEVEDPARPGSLNALRIAVEQFGFVGVKVYPPVGFLPLGNEAWKSGALGKNLDSALRALYTYCEAEQLPIMTHTNNSNGYKLGYGMLAEPKRWEAVLREFPRLRLNLGHFGHLEGDDGLSSEEGKKRGLKACESWMRQAAVLMETYPNVYADSGYSAVPTDQDFQDRYFKLLSELFKTYPRSKSRFMYGSDWWLNTLSEKSETFVNAFHHLFEERFDGAQRRRFMGQNALRYLGLVDDSDRPTNSNRNRNRIEALYGDTFPRWLAR